MIELKRHRGQFPPPKGYYVPAIDERKGCIYTCPECGVTCGLALRDVIIPEKGIKSTHKVQPNGEVQPSVVCVGDGDAIKCKFHDYIKLLDWEP